MEPVVDDWATVTDEEKKRLPRLIFTEIRADHAPDGVKVEFKRAAWEPYVEFVQASRRREEPTVTTSERKTGLKHARVVTVRLVQDERGWLRLTG